MKINIKVTPSSRTQSVITQADGSLKVNLKAPAKANKANFELFVVLAKHFKVPQSRISIIHGANSKNKVVVID